MLPLRSLRPILAGFLIGALIPLAATAAVSQWDPGKVLSLAQQLEKAANAFYNSVYDQPPELAAGQLTSGHHELLDKTRIIRSESMYLVAQLKDGKGMSETRNPYRRIRELVDDLDEDARETFLVGESKAKLDTLDGLLTQLKAYYGK